MKVEVTLKGEIKDEDRPKVEASIGNLTKLFTRFVVNEDYKRFQGEE